jgi:hypothetical protein
MGEVSVGDHTSLANGLEATGIWEVGSVTYPNDYCADNYDYELDLSYGDSAITVRWPQAGCSASRVPDAVYDAESLTRKILEPYVGSWGDGAPCAAGE